MTVFSIVAPWLQITVAIKVLIMMGLLSFLTVLMELSKTKQTDVMVSVIIPTNIAE